MGDSYAANGPMDSALETDACVHSPHSWPNQLRELAGVDDDDFVDESCDGAVLGNAATQSTNLAAEAKSAERAGAFGSETRLVAIQLGFNDNWRDDDFHPVPDLPTCVVTGGDVCGADHLGDPDDHGITGTKYADELAKLVTYVKYYAPRARIVVVGYPQVVDDTQTTICLNMNGMGEYVQPRAEGFGSYMSRLDAAQREAAQELGVDYLDLREVFAGHGPCTPQPWVNGFLTSGTDWLLHPSATGDAATAAALNAMLDPR